MGTTLNYKIKLVAIAKDESAYLTEWIHHHFYFGVDAVHIYINNTKDNSASLLDKLGKFYPVTYSIKDDLYSRSGEGFQTNAYNEMVDRAIEENFSHVLLLDIDEFWTPLDFKTDIKTALEQMGEAGSYLFNWALHQDESEFCRCFKPQLVVKKVSHVKCLMNLSKPYDRVGIHNVYGRKVEYKTADGQPYLFAEEDNVKAILDGDTVAKPLPFLIVHRLYRSQKEYVSMLVRGRPKGVLIKDNRNGYYTSAVKTDLLCFEAERLDTYYHSLDAMIAETKVGLDIEAGKQYVLNRYQQALDLFRTQLDLDNKIVLHKALRHIGIPEVEEIFTKLAFQLKPDPKEIKKHETNVYHAALYYEKLGDYGKALEIIKVAQMLAPENVTIKEKVALYSDFCAEIAEMKQESNKDESTKTLTLTLKDGVKSRLKSLLYPK